ncbi:MAG: GNAT family N-acetyltransferase [Clostridiales bacterium]|nr:GNAT family N-acetyltransferase [Clostridiales bacterium]
MSITYEELGFDKIDAVRDLCNELMLFQKSKAYIEPERFDTMSFETRLLPSLKGARDNYLIVAKDDESVIAYAYSNIANKNVYASGPFGQFFDMDSVDGDFVGCLSQFFIKEEYRGIGIGSKLFDQSISWLNNHVEIKDIFIYVSNGNSSALNFYKSKGFNVSHEIMDGFITVMRNTDF